MVSKMNSPSIMLLYMTAIAGAWALQPSQPPPPTTEETLQQVAESLQMYVEPLPQIPKIYGYSVQNSHLPTTINLTIGMYLKTWKFHRDLPSTPVFVYGTSADAATFPGPTIVARHGVPLAVKWENHLPPHHILPFDTTIETAIAESGDGVPTVVHLHGGVHPPESDGSPFAWFTADYRETGPEWTLATYTYPNIQPPGNLWYHDHALGLTRANLLAGLLGAYVVEKPEFEDSLDLPTGEDYDLHLVLVDRSFNVDGTLYMNSTGNNPSIHPQWQPEYFGEAIVVNGKAWPYLNVTRRKYRFRIINASNARYFRLALSNNLPFTVIGSDASYLAAPVETPTVLLATAESIDVVIDFSPSTTSTAELTNDAPYPFPTGTEPGELTGKVMSFNILSISGGSSESPIVDSAAPPKKLTTSSYSDSTPAIGPVTETRYIVMYEYQSATGEPTHLYINGLRLDDPVTETPKSGSTEMWNVINLTGDNHPLHLHLATFQAIKVQELLDLETFKSCMTTYNDAVKCNVTSHLAGGKTLPVLEYEKTWKNVVKIEPGYMTSVVVAFKLPETNETFPFDATAEPGYVYHCHILDHEDNEMIRPLKLIQ